MGILESLRKLVLNSDAVLDPSPPQTDLGTGFLHLPGEIRNQIYAHVIYPHLDMVQVNASTLPEHLGYNILSPPIFRASRQVRAEALSYICAKRKIQILRIQSANIFFDAIGPAIGEIKELLVEQDASELLRTDASKDSVARFFAFIEQASALKEFDVSGLGRMPSMGAGGVHGNFLTRVEELRERGVEVTVWFGKARK